MVVEGLLPTNQNCDPTAASVGSKCEKGDLVAPHIADCDFVHTEAHPISCTADGNTGRVISWVVAPEKDNLCQPVKKNVKFICGSKGSNTRCVCSDYKVEWNNCRCQYWTEVTPGENQPSFCTTHYLGGSSKVHQYSCCNNCHKETTYPLSSNKVCEGVTYQGGSSGSYCGQCGQALGGGRLKWFFNCVNCSIQNQCEALCNKKVPTMAGFCWKWASCFKGCCTNQMVSHHHGEHEQLLIKELNLVLQSGEERFCGDTICQAQESHINCPGDCCYKVNNATCPSTAKCLPSCCEQTNCCMF